MAISLFKFSVFSISSYLLQLAEKHNTEFSDVHNLFFGKSIDNTFLKVAKLEDIMIYQYTSHLFILSAMAYISKNHISIFKMCNLVHECLLKIL